MKAQGEERWRQIINQDMEVSEAREKRGFALQSMSEEELVAQKQSKGKGKGKKRKAKGADAQADAQADATEVAASDPNDTHAPRYVKRASAVGC